MQALLKSMLLFINSQSFSPLVCVVPIVCVCVAPMCTFARVVSHLVYVDTT